MKADHSEGEIRSAAEGAAWDRSYDPMSPPRRKTYDTGDNGALAERYDVAIIGGGLAGQSLARHLLLETDKRVLLVERREELPQAKQKYGESTVQLAGFYYSRVLDLEEYLLREHFLKYNLRFYWPTQGRSNMGFEDMSHGFIHDLSNVASYQLNRNVFERELLRRNLEDERFTLRLGAKDLKVELQKDGPTGGDHRLRFVDGAGEHHVSSSWVVDTAGRNRVLARQQGLERPSTFRHASLFWWVDGLLDIERLTDVPLRDRRKAKHRKKLGHLPVFLATNHFCGEGFWFWVIPLQGRTSLGLVFDRDIIPWEDVNRPEKAIDWVCERFPLLARELKTRPVVDWMGLQHYPHDCAQTISADRWGMSGEAGRFTDPLYSPGSDLISIYNTLVVDAIRSKPEELQAKTRTYEQVQRAVYGAYVPSYADGYVALGDPEAFALKYTWELAIYFAFYVFPFINDAFTDARFVPSHLKAFSRLGPWNAALQKLLKEYSRWRLANVGLPTEPAHFDFNTLAPLARARTTFHEIGISTDEMRKVLTDQLVNLEEMGRFVVARVASRMLEVPEILHSAAFVEAIDPAMPPASRDDVAALWQRAQASGDGRRHEWTFCHKVMDVFPDPPSFATGKSPAMQVGASEQAAEDALAMDVPAGARS
jgi:flavin-dependent dehydrogenase